MNRFIAILAGFAILIPAIAQNVVPYPAIPGMNTSTAYSLTVSDIPIWVEAPE